MVNRGDKYLLETGEAIENRKTPDRSHRGAPNLYLEEAIEMDRNVLLLVSPEEKIPKNAKNVIDKGTSQLIVHQLNVSNAGTKVTSLSHVPGFPGGIQLQRP